MNYWQQVKSFGKSTTARLGLSYLAIIMLMSISFSFVFYNTSSRALDREVPQRLPRVYREDILSQNGLDINDYLQQRINEGRHELLVRLVSLNLLILIGGAALSYLLARRTLEPIEANMDAQAQFVSDASHELRTPLTALQTMNEVALRKTKISSNEAKEVFGNNISEVTKLRQLTDSLLNLARNDNTVRFLEPVALSEAVTEALNTVLSAASAKQITIEDNVPKISVLGDSLSLIQATVALLDNAIKYSPEKSKVYVTAEVDGEYAMLKIRDEGAGIQPVHLPHIFDRFYRADASRSKQGSEGYGVGLALAKKIIEQQAGEIGVESTPDKGSTFTIKLFLAPST